MLPSAETLGPFLWRSSLLIGAAYLLNAVLFRRCPANRYTVLVIVVLLLPMIWISAHAPLSLFSIDGDAYLPADPVINEIVLKSRQWNAPGDWIAGQVKVEEAGRAGGFDVKQLLLPLWLAGMCVFMLRHLGHQIRLEGLVRRARPVREGSLHQCFMRIRNLLGASPRIRLLEADSLPGPAAAGIIFPAVFLPAGLRGEQGSGLDETLAHEILHHKRRDLLFHHITLLVRSIFWFHPLVFLVHRSLGMERERAVDLAVVEALGDSDGYINKLHETARRVATSRLPAARATALLGARASVIRRRIKMLLNHTRFHTARRPVLFATSLVLVFCVAASFLAIGSCAGAKSAAAVDDASKEVKLDMTRVVGTDSQGDYRLYQGFESVSRVALLPEEKANIESEEEYMTFLEEEAWTFIPEAQALRLREPVDLKDKEIYVYGKRAMPWIWSVANWNNNKVWEIEKGTVRIAVNGRDAVEGEDFEVDYENGFVRYLKAEDCIAKNDFKVGWGIRPDPVNEPNVIRGVGFSKGARGSKGDGDLVSKLLREVGPTKSSFCQVWSTSDPGKFMPTRPFKGKPFVLAVMRKTSFNKRDLKLDVDFTFDEKTQEILLSSPDLVDLEKESLTAWGIAEDNRTYQFPGPIEKGSVKYTFSGRELEEGKDFVVDYRRSRVTLKNHDFISMMEDHPHSAGFAIISHSLVVGDWKIGN